MTNARNRHLSLLITTLILVGLALFAYRAWYLHVPLLPQTETNSWVVELNLQFQPSSGPVKASIHIPLHPPGYSSLDETFLARNYGVNFDSTGDHRMAVWTIRRATGKQSLYYRAIFYPDPTIEGQLSKLTEFPKFDLPETEKSAAETLINDVRAKSADTATFTAELLKKLNDTSNQNAELLLNHNFKLENVTAVAIKVLTLSNIKARYVQGLELRNQKNAKFLPFLAVYDGNTWKYFNGANGQQGLPKDILIWSYSEAPITEVIGGSKVNLTATVAQSPINALEVAKKLGKNSELIKLSLLSLPLETQQVYHVLLTVPVGAFVILILRNIIGLVTFGTFMPVLIALAFRETRIVYGVFLFSFVVSAGLMVRFYLDQLRLLLVPRLTAILTTVILLMMTISIFSQQLGFVSGISIALFPMVILTMTIERMCVLWDERGAREAIKSGVGSLLAASLAYVCMHNAFAEYIFFAFPELLLVLLGLTLIIGQYRGYRLSEIKRFKALAKVN